MQQNIFASDMVLKELHPDWDLRTTISKQQPLKTMEYPWTHTHTQV